MLVVESVTPDGIAARARVRDGDRLVAYHGTPLVSPHALRALEENPLDAEAVVLTLERGGMQRHLTLPVGCLGIQVRPELPPDLLTAYRAVQAGVDVSASDRAAAWEALAIQSGDASSWLWHQAGEQWARARQFSKANAAYRTAWDRLPSGPQCAAHAATALAIARSLREQREWQEALAWYERALAMDEAAVRPCWSARDRIGVGQMRFFLGDPDSSQRCCEAAIAALEHHSNGLEWMPSGLICLGLIAYYQGDLGAATRHLERSRKILERYDPEGLEMAHTLTNLGVVAADSGDWDLAQQRFSGAIAIHTQLESPPRELARMINNLGNVEINRRRFDSARAHFTRSLEIYQEIERDTEEVAMCLNNLGVVALALQDLDEAEANFRRAYEIRFRVHPTSTETAICLFNLGETALARLERNRARSYYERARRLQERAAPGSLDHANTLERLGRMEGEEGDPHTAIALLREAVQIVEGLRTQIVAPERRALLLAEHTEKYGRLIAELQALGQDLEALSVLEMARARSLLERFPERLLDLTADAAPELLARQAEIDQRRTDVQVRLTYLPPTATEEEFEALRRERHDLEQEAVELADEIRTQCPRYATLRHPLPLRGEEAQAQLPPGTLLLSYFVSEQQTTLFAVTRGSCRLTVLRTREGEPLDAATLKRCVDAFREAVATEQLDLSPVLEQGRALYDLLLGPVHAEIDRAKRLLLCPDGPLHELPWPALVQEEPTPGGRPAYLGCHIPLQITFSMTLLAQLRLRAPRPESLPTLCLFGAPENPEWPPLPHARREVETIAALFRERADVRCRLGAEATREAVFAESADANLLHFACHGHFDPRLPLSSALILSRSDGSAGGLLPLWEIFSRLRLQARLVTLSACSTGRGDTLPGEGLIGLTRAFTYAGAQSVLVSLWEVGDESTCALMSAFYAELARGKDPARALHRAIQTMSRQPKWRAPRFWSGFTLHGDPG